MNRFIIVTRHDLIFMDRATQYFVRTGSFVIFAFLFYPDPGRFRVDEVTQDQREDCYVATLHINQVDVQDSRPYYLVVENERGADRHSVALKVEGLFPGEFQFRIISRRRERVKRL
jgi:hypothetical protein